MDKWCVYRKDGKLDAILAGDEEFVRNYCASNGWTYQKYLPMNVNSDSIHTAPEPVEQNAKETDQREEFLEDCVVEMSMQIHAE